MSKKEVEYRYTGEVGRIKSVLREIWIIRRRCKCKGKCYVEKKGKLTKCLCDSGYRYYQLGKRISPSFAKDAVSSYIFGRMYEQKVQPYLLSLKPSCTIKVKGKIDKEFTHKINSFEWTVGQ